MTHLNNSPEDDDVGPMALACVLAACMLIPWAVTIVALKLFVR
jgi:hypothetical protein